MTLWWPNNFSLQSLFWSWTHIKPPRGIGCWQPIVSNFFESKFFQSPNTFWSSNIAISTGATFSFPSVLKRYKSSRSMEKLWRSRRTESTLLSLILLSAGERYWVGLAKVVVKWLAEPENTLLRERNSRNLVDTVAAVDFHIFQIISNWISNF